MKKTSAFMLKSVLLFCVLCAPALVQAAPQWEYVYTPTALPEEYPGGAWNLEAYGDATPSIENGRLHFNVRDGLFFYGRDEQADPRIYASTFTYEWRQEVVNPGVVFSMAMYYADGQGIWVELIYNESLTLIADGERLDLPAGLATGAHTYRLVKSDSQVELYVDSASVATMPVGGYTVNYLELSGWGMGDAAYEAYWDHVAYTRGAYTPAELPSPGEEPPAADNAITRHNYTGPLLVNVNATSEPLVSYVTDADGEAASGKNVSFSISRYPLGATGQQLNKLSGLTDEDGLIDVSLKLGDLPAEYDVKAECQSCAPGSNEVTFTCCGKVVNDHFSQSGQTWSPTCYANNNCQLNPNATIGWRGCALTSLATLINYYNATVYSGIPRTNPGDLNTYLRGLPGGYNERNDVNFDAVYRYSSGSASFVGRYDVDDPYNRDSLLDMADGLIRSGFPLIFRIGGHFVLVIGKCGESFVVADPAGGIERLYNPDNVNDREFEGLRVFGSW